MEDAIHGKGQYVELEDPNSLGTYIDVSSNCTDASMAFSKDNVPTGTFGEDDKTSISGQRDGTFGLTGFMDQDLRDLLFDWWNYSGKLRARYGPEGNASGKERQTAYFHMTGFGDGGNVNSALGTSPSFQRTGATARDTW